MADSGAVDGGGTDGADAAGAGLDLGLGDSTAEVEVDLGDLRSCRGICGGQGGDCDPAYEWSFAPPSSGLAEWGALQAGVDCDEVPPRDQTDPLSGRSLRITRFRCACR
jgi:hypothetical protein